LTTRAAVRLELSRTEIVIVADPDAVDDQEIRVGRFSVAEGPAPAGQSPLPAFSTNP